MKDETTPRPTLGRTKGEKSPGPDERTLPSPSKSGMKVGRRQQNRAAAVLMAPFFLLLGGVFIAPLLTALWLSLFAENNTGLGFGTAEQTFVGLRSYAVVLSDPTFISSLALILTLCLFYIPVVIAGALLLALLLDSGVAKLRAIMQMGLFLPHAVPGIIAAIIWLYLYTPGISPVTDALGAFNLEINFLGVNMVVPAIVNIAVWTSLGYYSVIFYAALQAVPREVLEASQVDGAGPVRTALTVKVPLIRSAMVMVLLFSTIWTLQLFTEPMLLSQATPAINSRFSPSMYIYDAAFTRNNYGIAAAASVILLLSTMALSYAMTRVTGRLQRKEGR